MAKRKSRGVPLKPHKDESAATAAGDSPTGFEYILELTVEHVRCFSKRQTLDLSNGAGKPARWTVLLGENGTGKTTILQLLAMFARFAAPPMEVATKNASRARHSRVFPRLMWGWRGPLPYLSQPFLRQTTVGEEIAWTAKLKPFASLEGEPIGRYRTAGITMLSGGGGYATRLAHSRLANTCIFGYGAARRMHDPAMASSADEDATSSLFSDTVSLRNAEEWLLWLDYSVKSASSKSSRQTQIARLQQVQGLLLALLPYVESIRFSSEAGVNPRPRVEFKTPDGWVAFRSLGYGYQSLILWVTDLVSRMVEAYPESPNPMSEPAVVLVDEIDLHLHPRWQRNVISMLSAQFPNTQFVATTHSPLIVQGGPDVNLAVMKRVGDHVEIKNDVDEIRSWRVDQILTSDLFDMPSARPAYFERLLALKSSLLGIKNRDEAQDAELKEVQAALERVPVSGQPADQLSIDYVRKALDLLRKQLP